MHKTHMDGSTVSISGLKTALGQFFTAFFGGWTLNFRVVGGVGVSKDFDARGVDKDFDARGVDKDFDAKGGE